MGGIRYADIKELPRFPETLDGESLLPQLTGNVARRREWAFCAYHGDRCATGTFMLRRGQWKSIVHTGFSPELFDLVADPWETTNLATKRPEIAAQLDAILAGNFDCAGIDARAKQYDRENFTRWRAATKKAGPYGDTMARIYSGFDRLCIEDIKPWTDADEQLIESWLQKG